MGSAPLTEENPSIDHPGDRRITRRRSSLLVLFAALVAAIIGVAGVAGMTGVFDTSPKDMNGNPVRYDLDASPRPEASAAPDGHGRFTAASVGLDVPLGSLDVVDGEVTPPGFQSAYLIRNYGVAPDRAGLGAVYVVMHSLRNGAVGPGNALIDVDQGKARIEVGATITVDNVGYTVTGTKDVRKDELPSSDVWTAGSNELVVITCLQRPEGGPSFDNIVITGRRA